MSCNGIVTIDDLRDDVLRLFHAGLPPELNQPLILGQGKGPEPGDLMLIAGQTGLGKSILALQMIRERVDLGHDRIFFASLQSMKERIYRRWVSAVTGVAVRELRSDLIESAHVAAVEKAVSFLNGTGDSFLDKRGLSLEEIRSLARKSKARFGGLDLIVFDSFKELLTQSDHHLLSLDDRFTKRAQVMKSIALDLGAPVVCTVPLPTRMPQLQEPTLDDFENVGLLEEKSDIVALIHLREPLLETDPDTLVAPVRADLIVAKDPRGGRGTIPMLFDGKRARFTKV